jgi:peptidoglycan/LPS O-acetylase OafA/YrhL
MISMRDYLGVEQGTAVAQGPRHQPELQSLRGLAALLVVIHHCSFYYDYSTNVKLWAEVILNAHAAVVLFFVLSGYVLCRSLVQGSLSVPDVVQFYIRRAFRIFPALWLGVILAFSYVMLFHGRSLPTGVTAWWWLGNHREFPEHLYNYLFTIAGLSTTLPLPLWTMKIELLASALLPIAALALIRAPTVFLISSLGLSIFVALAPWSLGVTLTYIPAFVLGACIVNVVPWAQRYVKSDRSWLIIAVIGLIILLFCRNFFLADFRHHYDAAAASVAEAAGGTLLITAVTARQRVFSCLRWAGFVWLGDVSYSLYLLHLPVIGLVAGIGGEMLKLKMFNGDLFAATGYLTLIVLVIVTPLSALSYHYVELPSIKLGKKFHMRILRTFAMRRLEH